MKRLCLCFLLILCFFEAVEGNPHSVSKIDLDDPVAILNLINDATVVVWETDTNGSNLFYEPLVRDLYSGSGWVASFYDDGVTPRSLHKLKNGKEHGARLLLYESGKNKLYIKYNNGEQHGKGLAWYENGQKSMESSWSNGKRDGIWREWYQSGMKKSESSSKDDKIDGNFVFWYENGQKKSVGHYKDSKANGRFITWTQGGQKIAEISYINGLGEGLFSQWYENGQRSLAAEYYRGKMISSVVWKPNGTLCPLSNVKDGNGTLVLYDEFGHEKLRRIFQRGEEYLADSKNKPVGKISSDELDKLLEDSIPESPPPLAPPPPSP